MDTFRELKKYCDEAMKKYPQYEKKYKKELIYAKRFYNNGMNLVEMLKEGRPSTRYVIPFLLGLTEKVTNEEFEFKFFEAGNSAVDIDMDFDPIGKQKIQDYLIEKFGKDKVLHVGTFSRLGPASASKDLLKVYKIDFKESNEFTRVLDSKLTWKENLENIETNFPVQWSFYNKHKNILDMVPYFINKIRQGGSHAGGIVILDEPVYKRIPIDRVGGNLVTAFPESNQESILDDLGVIKFDILSISILDVIRNTINMVDEKLYLISEDNVTKIVPASYIDAEFKQF